MSADKALPDPRALAALSSLMALIADADGAQARLKQIMAITAEARAEIARAKAASTSLDEKIVAHKAASTPPVCKSARPLWPVCTRRPRPTPMRWRHPRPNGQICLAAPRRREGATHEQW
jgi:hypothetical protein